MVLAANLFRYFYFLCRYIHIPKFLDYCSIHHMFIWLPTHSLILTFFSKYIHTPTYCSLGTWLHWCFPHIALALSLTLTSSDNGWQLQMISRSPTYIRLVVYFMMCLSCHSHFSIKCLHPRASFFGVTSLLGPLIFTFIVDCHMWHDIQLTLEAEQVVVVSMAGMGLRTNKAEIVFKMLSVQIKAKWVAAVVVVVGNMHSWRQVMECCR